MNSARLHLWQLGGSVRDAALQPAGQIAATLWVVATMAVFMLAGGFLPFDRPAVSGMSVVQQILLPTFGMLEVFLLMAITYFLTAHRVAPNVAARAPARALAA